MRNKQQSKQLALYRKNILFTTTLVIWIFKTFNASDWIIYLTALFLITLFFSLKLGIFRLPNV